MMYAQYKQHIALQRDKSNLTMVTYCAFCNRSLPAAAQLCPSCNTHVGVLADAEAPTQPVARPSRPLHLPELRLGRVHPLSPLGTGRDGNRLFCRKRKMVTVRQLRFCTLSSHKIENWSCAFYKKRGLYKR